VLPEARLLIGSLASEHLLVRHMGDGFVLRDDPYDNWFRCDVRICVRGFVGELVGDFLPADFSSFRDQLRTLDATLVGEAKFAPVEPWVRAHVVVDRLGHIEVNCTATDDFAGGNELRFVLRGDQTMLSAIVRDLDALLARFPSRP
jgi:hypothetical protein